MKHTIKYILQKLLGFDNYLYVFSIFKIRTLKWDRNENQIFDFIKMLPDDGIILDIGANIGIMTAIIAKAKSNSQVIAFEPIPSNLKTLKKIVSHLTLTNVLIKEIALGDKNGEIKMLMPVEKDVKLQGLSHVVEDESKAKKEGLVFTVPVHTLDEMQFENKVKGIKIDVENFEYKVLKGALKLLEKDKPIVYCELWDDKQREATMLMLAKLGYTAHAHTGDELQPYQENMQDASHNFFFLPS